jgi:hypothetical protein
MIDLPTSPMIDRALLERPPGEVSVLICDACGKLTYYNDGSHATCEFCRTNLDHLLDEDSPEILTLEDFWDRIIDAADYP